jgi:hypothetical protein
MTKSAAIIITANAIQFFTVRIFSHFLLNQMQRIPGSTGGQPSFESDSGNAAKTSIRTYS